MKAAGKENMIRKEKEVSSGKAILKVEDVRKEYLLGTVTGSTLKEAFLERIKKEKTGLKHNKRFVALDGVSFTVESGETIGLIGSNGAGKSTLLKLISHITVPTSGRILVNGRVTSMLEVGTGFHQELTGRENIYLNGSILGMSKREIEQKIDSIIEFSECGDFIDTPVKRYSSGMYVKLAFSVAAHLNSEIMIMDEVLAVGDIKFQHKCLNKMKEVAEQEGRTIIYVSHNMDTIRKLCKRCIVLDHGKILFDGDVDEAIRIYTGDTIRKENSIDFTKYIRPGWLGRKDVRLTWGEYQNAEKGVITENNLEILLRWKAIKNIEHMGLRIEIMDESEKAFATAVYYDVFSGQPDEEGENIFVVSLENIMNGNYRTIYTLFCIDGYQEGIDLDCVRGLDLTIQNREKEQPMHWKNQAWGNVRIWENG